MNLAELLKHTPEKEFKYPDIEAQKETMADFMRYQNQVFKVGDYVKLNRLGRSKYRLPSDKQVAMITHVHDKPVIHDEGLHHCVLVAVFDSHIQEYSFNFAYLEAV
jgi:hypothetical protein